MDQSTGRSGTTEPGEDEEIRGSVEKGGHTLSC
jgi:hypothetical protein